MKNDLAIGKFLFEFRKDKAKTYYKVFEDKDDSWFIYVIKYDSKSNTQKSYSMIIQQDLDSHLKLLIDDGWQKTEIQ